MKEVRLKVSWAGARFSHAPGQIIEVGEELADAMIADGRAEAVSDRDLAEETAKRALSEAKRTANTLKKQVAANEDLEVACKDRDGVIADLEKQRDAANLRIESLEADLAARQEQAEKDAAAQQSELGALQDQLRDLAEANKALTAELEAAPEEEAAK